MDAKETARVQALGDGVFAAPSRGSSWRSKSQSSRLARRTASSWATSRAGASAASRSPRVHWASSFNLLANTAPVAWGAIGTPIVTLAAVSGLDQVTLSARAGHQLPFVSVLVPFWLVTTFVLMEGGTWKQAWEVWPAALCSRLSFALMQWFASGSNAFHLMTDVVSGVFSVICTALFLRFVWHPRTRFLLKSERQAAGSGSGRRGPVPQPELAGGLWSYNYSVGQTVYAWLPWTILIVCCGIWGMPAWKAYLNNLFASITFKTTLLGSILSGSLSLPAWEMPALHNLVQRMPPVAPANAKPEVARFVINWLSAAGTGVFITALLSGLALRMSGAQWKEAIVRTRRRMKIPVLVIGQVLKACAIRSRGPGLDELGAIWPLVAGAVPWTGLYIRRIKGCRAVSSCAAATQRSVSVSCQTSRAES